MKSIIYKVTLFSLMCMLTTACMFGTRPPTATNFYDLGNDNPVYVTGLNIGDITVTSCYNTRMVFRTKPWKVELAEYHRWLTPPDQLLENSLDLAFKTASSPTVDIHIARLEMDEVTSKFIFVANYTISCKKSKSRRFSVRQKTESVTPAEFSKMFKAATAKLLKEINNEIK